MSSELCSRKQAHEQNKTTYNRSVFCASKIDNSYIFSLLLSWSQILTSYRYVWVPLPPANTMIRV